MFFTFLKQKKKCLLIDPGINLFGILKGFVMSKHFPFGVLNIATFLENNSCPTGVLALDYYLPEDKEVINRNQLLLTIENIIENEIRENSPLVIGISMTYTVQYVVVLQIVELIKKNNPNIITVVGGSHVSFLDKKTLLDCSSLDIVARGEGEWTMLDIMSCIKEKSDFSRVDGITFRENGKIVRTQDRKFGDLSALPILNFGLIPAKFYKGRSVNIAATRGCDYNCKFCSERVFWGNKVRRLDIEKLSIDVKQLFSKYKIGFLSFEDSMLYLSSDYFKKLALALMKIKKKRLGHILTRIDCVPDKDSLEIVSKVGFDLIMYGIETGSEVVLKAMNKQIDLKKEREILIATKKAGVNAGAFWLMGHPGDNPVEAKKSIDYMELLYADGILDKSIIARFVPYPGTDFYADPRKYGIDIFNYNFEEWRRYRSVGVCQLDGFTDAQIIEAYNAAFRKSLEYEFLNSQNN